MKLVALFAVASCLVLATSAFTATCLCMCQRGTDVMITTIETKETTCSHCEHECGGGDGISSNCNVGYNASWFCSGLHQSSVFGIYRKSSQGQSGAASCPTIRANVILSPPANVTAELEAPLGAVTFDYSRHLVSNGSTYALFYRNNTLTLAYRDLHPGFVVARSFVNNSWCQQRMQCALGSCMIDPDYKGPWYLWFIAGILIVLIIIYTAYAVRVRYKDEGFKGLLGMHPRSNYVQISRESGHEHVLNS